VIFEIEMSERIRGKADKTEIEKNFSIARKAYSRKPGTRYTSTPKSSTSKSTSENIDLSLDETVIEKEKFSNIDSSLISDDSGDITIKPCAEFKESRIKDNLHLTMTQQNPFATLKYAVEAVPYFDGQNIPLNYFIERCEEAKSMLPRKTESQFIKIIRTRIIEARRTIQDQDFDSVSQLTKYETNMKQIYGPSKNVYQLQGELGCIYQKNEEDVVTYANRIKILEKQILEAYQTSGIVSFDHNTKASLEKDMCKCFIRGLKSEIEQRIAKNLDVHATVADALRIERELRAMTDLRQGSGGGSGKRETC